MTTEEKINKIVEAIELLGDAINSIPCNCSSPYGCNCKWYMDKKLGQLTKILDTLKGDE